MKIGKFIIENEIRQDKIRLKKLEEIGAPDVMIRGQRKMLEDLEKGGLNVSGEKSLLDLEFIKFEVKKGNGGKLYIVFDNEIKYFPNAKYGRFITR